MATPSFYPSRLCETNNLIKHQSCTICMAQDLWPPRIRVSSGNPQPAARAAHHMRSTAPQAQTAPRQVRGATLREHLPTVCGWARSLFTQSQRCLNPEPALRQTASCLFSHSTHQPSFVAITQATTHRSESPRSTKLPSCCDHPRSNPAAPYKLRSMQTARSPRRSQDRGGPCSPVTR